MDPKNDSAPMVVKSADPSTSGSKAYPRIASATKPKVLTNPRRAMMRRFSWLNRTPSVSSALPTSCALFRFQSHSEIEWSPLLTQAALPMSRPHASATQNLVSADTQPRSFHARSFHGHPTQGQSPTHRPEADCGIESPPPCSICAWAIHARSRDALRRQPSVPETRCGGLKEIEVGVQRLPS